MPLNVSYVTDQNKIHSGPGFPFINILRPLYGLRPLFSGNPPSYADPATPVAWQATHAQLVGDLVLDTNNNVQRCTAAGTSGATAPTWPTTIGSTVTDGTGGTAITWITCGPSWVWAAATAVVVNQQVRDSNNNIQMCVTPGTTGGTAPTWSTLYGGITSGDGATYPVSWKNLGPTLGAGAVTGELVFDVKASMLEIDADQYTSALDKRVMKEDGKITGTLRELNLAIAARSIPNAAYTSGSDAAFPAGAQAYEEIGFGGLLDIAAPCVCIVSPRPNYSNPNRYVMAWLNRCVPSAGGSWPFSLKKVSDYKVDWDGMGVTWMPAGYQIGRMLRQP
jgi:hypothetical protein